jgi:hypothetical protein
MTLNVTEFVAGDLQHVGNAMSKISMSDAMRLGHKPKIDTFSQHGNDPLDWMVIEPFVNSVEKIEADCATHVDGQPFPA